MYFQFCDSPLNGFVIIDLSSLLLMGIKIIISLTVTGNPALCLCSTAFQLLCLWNRFLDVNLLDQRVDVYTVQ